MNQENKQFNLNDLNNQSNNGMSNNQPSNDSNFNDNPQPQPVNSSTSNNLYNQITNTTTSDINLNNQTQINNNFGDQSLNNSMEISSTSNVDSQNSIQFNSSINQQTLTNTSSEQNISKKKNNKNIKIIVIISFIAVVVIGVLILVISILGNKVVTDYNDPSVSDAIVIKDDNGLYGVYNSNGKKVADFEYKSISEFLNGSAIVENSNNETGIINSSGKMVVDFGKYNYIREEGYLYVATDNDYNKFLLNSKGKIIYDLKNASVISYIIPKEILIVELENSIDVLDYEGNSLLKLNDKNDYKFYENKDNYSTLYHNNVSYIIDIYNRKIVHKEKSSTPYCVNSVNTEDKTKYVLSECENSQNFISMDNDNKLFSLSDCTNLFYEHGNLLCVQDYKRYVVDEKGNKGIEIYASNVEYIDGKNYIYKNNDKTEFYLNGKLIKTVDCTNPYTMANRNEGLYILKDTCSINKNIYSYYDSKGNKKIDENYIIANEFDKNGYAIVSNDGINKYLINSNGKKISKEYDAINYNQNFKPINIYVAKKENKEIVLNNKGKEILVTEGDIDYYDTYFTVSINNKISYYNFDGKKIF